MVLFRILIQHLPTNELEENLLSLLPIILPKHINAITLISTIDKLITQKKNILRSFIILNSQNIYQIINLKKRIY